MRYLYRKYRRLTDEEKAANAAARAEREKAAMTCQVCERRILANKGIIAHHGYQRPYEGWQTASCMGARHLPFEASRERLKDFIEVLEGILVREREHRRKLDAEEIPCIWIPFRTKKIVEITRDNFEEMRKQYQFYAGVYTFDDLKRGQLRELDRKIEYVEDDLKRACTRRDTWTQTHTWNQTEEKWEKVSE